MGVRDRSLSASSTNIQRLMLRTRVGKRMGASLSAYPGGEQSRDLSRIMKRFDPAGNRSGQSIRAINIFQTTALLRRDIETLCSPTCFALARGPSWT